MEQDRNLIEQFVVFSRLMMHKHHHMKGCQTHNPYRGQGRILSLLKLEPKMSQKKLSFLLGIRPQSIGELLGKLEQAGYIKRNQSAEDRRAMEIELTEQGLAAAVADETPQEKENSLFDCLNDEEKTNLSSYMDKLIESLKEGLGEQAEEMLKHHHGPHGHHGHECHEGHGHHCGGQGHPGQHWHRHQFEGQDDLKHK
ncbi:MAG: MarR family transcriptional regulator [Sporomusaceae bacterium]|nr:MarR family transcriptional regulator [Sporomusaceae bacterium]